VSFKNLKRINRQKLTEICEINGFEILSVDLKNNSFTIEIPHFTKYSFTDAVEEKN
jgi:hypothetical protein